MPDNVSYDYDSMYGFLLEELRKGTADNVADRMVKAAYGLTDNQATELRSEFASRYKEEIQEVRQKRDSVVRQIAETDTKRKKLASRRNKAIIVSIAVLIVLTYLSLPVFISQAKYQPLAKNLPLIIQPQKLIPMAANQIVYEITKPTPGPCLLFTAEVCKDGKAIQSPNGLAVAFYIPSGATIFAPTDGKFWAYKDGSIFLSANYNGKLSLPVATFTGTNGSSYQLAVLGKWDFLLAPPEQGNHTYKKGEAIATLTMVDGYLVGVTGLPNNEYNFVVNGKSASYMSPFLEK